MIQLTRLNHVPLVLNSDLIEFVDVTPDTVISMSNGEKIRVLESAEEIVRRVIQFRRQILGGLPQYRRRDDPEGESLKDPAAGDEARSA